MGVDIFTKKFGEGDHIFQKGKEKKCQVQVKIKK